MGLIREIFEVVKEGERDLSQVKNRIAERYNINNSEIEKKLKIMEKEGLIKKENNKIFNLI